MFIPQPLEVAISVPSGKLVYANDLRHIYRIPEEKGSPQSSNGALWNKIITMGYGEAGLLHGYVGNSCPSINKKGDMLIIGNSSSDGNWESRDDLPGKQVGSICTDLWWYSIADKMDFEIHARGAGIKPEDISKHYDGVIEVKPGRYLLKHYYPYCDHYKVDEDFFPEIFATISLSLEPVINQKLPDEGVAEMIMSFTDVDYACVDYDKDKFDEINKDESLAFKYYQILIHWEDPDLGTMFTTPKFTDVELQDFDLIRKRIYKGRAKKEIEEREHRETMKTLQANMDAMTPKEKKAHQARVDKVCEDILRRLKKEEK